MKIVVPMAGRGSRFAPSDIPKPLIPILGKPMLAWSLESVLYSFPRVRAKDFIFISLREHEEKFQITDQVERMIGKGFQIKFLDTVTDGPVCTVLTIKDLLDPEEDFLTCDCDQYFRCRALRSTVEEAREHGWAGLIPTFESRSTAYSYVKLDRKKNATATAEKKVISSHAAIGIYYFGKSTIFTDAAEEMVRDDLRTKNEFYMSPLYNIVIKNGGTVRIVQTEKWQTLGTPEEAQQFIDSQK